MIGEPITRDNIGWNDPPGFDRTLGRQRHHTDDFFDHRKAVLDRIRAAREAEKDSKRRR